MANQKSSSLNTGLNFWVIVTSLFYIGPCWTFAVSLSSAESLPCKADINCELGYYCSSNKCKPCANCTIYYRKPKPDGGRQCALSFSECGGCMPGFAFKEESGGMYSRRCYPLYEVYPELAKTSPVTIASSTVSEGLSVGGILIIVGGVLFLLCVFACAVLFLFCRRKSHSAKSTNSCVEHAEYGQQPPTAPYLGDEHPPAYEDSAIMSNLSTEPLLSLPEPTQSFVTYVVCEKERLNQAEVLQPPKYSRGQKQSDEGELDEDDDLGEEDVHSYGSAVTVYPEDVDFASHVDTFDFTGERSGSDIPHGDQDGIDTNAVELSSTHLNRSPRARRRLSQRAVSDSALRYAPVHWISSVPLSSSQVDLRLGNYSGMHVRLHGHRGSLRSLHPAADDSVLPPLPYVENLEQRFEDAGFESSLGEASSSGTSYSSLPGAASLLTSADSGILEEQPESTMNKEQTDQSSEEPSPDDSEAPAKRLRQDLEDEVMSTVLDIADLQESLTCDDAFGSRRYYDGR